MTIITVSSFPKVVAPSARNLFFITTSLFVLEGHVLAGSTLVLSADKVANLLVLCLLERRLVVLRTLTEELFLDKVDTYTCIC